MFKADSHLAHLNAWAHHDPSQIVTNVPMHQPPVVLQFNAFSGEAMNPCLSSCPAEPGEEAPQDGFLPLPSLDNIDQQESGTIIPGYSPTLFAINGEPCLPLLTLDDIDDQPARQQQQASAQQEPMGEFLPVLTLDDV
jgi:hypothetical protein